MTTVFPWEAIRRFSHLPPQPSPWQALLAAALQTPFYSRRQERQALEAFQRGLVGTGSPLYPAPVKAVPLRFFFDNVELFRNPRAGKVEARPLELPWQGHLRTVVVMPWFAVAGRASVMARYDGAELERRRPEVLVAPVAVLRRIAQGVMCGRVRLGQLRYGVVALQGTGFAVVSEADRELFWRAFQVPSLVQWRGFRGELLACGCEAQSGLHVRLEMVQMEGGRREAGDGKTVDARRPEPAQRWREEGIRASKAPVIGGVPGDPGEEELVLTSAGDLVYPVLRLQTELSADWETGRCGCGLETPRLVNLRSLSGQSRPNRAAWLEAGHSRQEREALSLAGCAGAG